MKKIKGQKGLSLVEVTIMLLVLMLLTSVLAPSMWDFIHDAQWVKVKEDCEAIGISFTRMTRDIGPCLRFTNASACNLAGRVDVLISTGLTATVNTTSGYAENFSGYTVAMTTTNWNDTSNRDTMENQFVRNTPAYKTPFGNYNPGDVPVGPLFGLGWRGAYLAPPIGPDPWGTAYYVNSGFNAVATDATGTGEGSPDWWWERDVICITAGPNQTLDSPIAGTGTGNSAGTYRHKDDFVFVISGSGK